MVVGNAGQSVPVYCAAGIVATKYRFVAPGDGTTVVLGPVTTGITSSGTLRYTAMATLPNSGGNYELQWDDGSNAWAGTEDVLVYGSVTPGITGQLKPPIHS